MTRAYRNTNEEPQYNEHGVALLRRRLGVNIPSANLSSYIPRNLQDEFMDAALRGWIRHNISKDGSAFATVSGFHQIFHDAHIHPASIAQDVGAAQRILTATEGDMLDAVSCVLKITLH